MYGNPLDFSKIYQYDTVYGWWNKVACVADSCKHPWCPAAAQACGGVSILDQPLLIKPRIYMSVCLGVGFFPRPDGVNNSTACLSMVDEENEKKTTSRKLIKERWPWYLFLILLKHCKV